MTTQCGRPVGAALVALVTIVGAPRSAAQVPCAGGTLAISAASDTPLGLPTFNVGQKAILSAVVTGFAAGSYAWTIPGPHIKDYVDDLSTQVSPIPPAATPWSTTALGPADLAASSLSLYWKPSPAQTDPLNGGPEARVVSLTVTPTAGGSCTVTTTLMVERNMVDATRQPEDLYTSTHRAPTTTNTGFGHVVDEHIYWHQFVGGGPTGSWQQFLAWHGFFLRRFNQWRTEFGYPTVAAWYPGRPLPTGPAFDHPAPLRLASFNPDANRIPTYYTIAGGTASDGGRTKLADYPTTNAFSGSFESSFHGQVHCNIGTHDDPNFFSSSGPFFGSMCLASSPKDPMFWRWHGFIDLLYRNHCKLKSLVCHTPADPTADPWIADNAADVAAVGAVPSPGPHWLSPDIWNRRAPVTTDACMPRVPPPDLATVGGVTRNCGSDADHENPVAGVQNYLYATLRNTGTAPVRTAYAEVAVYIANASTGLAWPADFTMLPESRQLITIQLEPGQVTSIGPLPWTPPSPTPSDHWCIYVRVLSVQEAPLVETANVDANVAASNSIAWRNMKIVTSGAASMMARFIVRNIRREEERLVLEVDAPPALLQAGRLLLRPGPVLQRALAEPGLQLAGIRALDGGVYAVTEGKARIAGVRLQPRQSGDITLQLEPATNFAAVGDIVVTQRSSQGVDGGVTMRVARAARRVPVRPKR